MLFMATRPWWWPLWMTTLLDGSVIVHRSFGLTYTTAQKRAVAWAVKRNRAIVIGQGTWITGSEIKKFDRVDRELSFDEAEAAGLDGTGRDGDTRFPYHISDLTAEQRERLGW